MRPEIPRTPSDRLRWALADAWTVARRDVIHWYRQPFVIVVGLLFPVMVLLMFGYLFGGAMSLGSGDYREFLVPGMLAMTMAFGLEGTMTSVANDAAKGVTDRFRSMPMAPSAVVLGRSVADMLNSALGLAVMIACGLVIGWRWNGTVGEALLALALLLGLRFSLLWVGIFLGLVVKGPESVTAVQILVWPVLFLSNTFVGSQTMPGWLGAISEWNPLSATVAATRELFGNPGWGGDSWVSQNALLMSVVWPLLIFAVFFPSPCGATSGSAADRRTLLGSGLLAAVSMLLALATTSPALVVDEFLLVGLALAAVAPWPVIVVAGLAVFLLSPRLSEDQQKSVTS